MELIIEKNQMFFCEEGKKVLIPGYAPKINYEGIRGEAFNIDNSLIIENIITELAKNKSIVEDIKWIFTEQKISNLIALIMFLPILCDFYATEACPARKLRDLTWEFIAVEKKNFDI